MPSTLCYPSIARSRSHPRGGILLGVLVFSVIISVLLAGVATFVTSHLARARAEADYATALNLAEAGINYEINKISLSPDGTGVDQKYTSTGALVTPTVYKIPVPGQANVYLPGQFTIKVRTDNPNDPDDTTGDAKSWSPPQPVVIEATGTVNPGTSYQIQRTIRIRGLKHGLFDTYALYGIGSTAMSGTQTVVNGTLGANGPLSPNSSTNIYGPVVFNGYPSGTCSHGTCTGGVQYQPNAVSWPTCSQVADACVTNKTGIPCAAGAGLTWLSTHNDNPQIQYFASNDSTHVTNPPTDLRVNAGCTTHSYDLSQCFPFQRDNNPGDVAGGNRYACGNTTYTYTNPGCTATVPAYGLNNKYVLILPGSSSGCRDYYFEHCDWASNQAVLIDNAKGPVHIWIADVQGSWNSWSSDNLGTTLHCTSSDPGQLRIYGCKSQTLSVNCNTNCGGCIYAFGGYTGNSPSRNSLSVTPLAAGSCVGTVVCSGSHPVINGCVVAGNVSCSGNVAVNFTPSPTNNDPTDMHLWYGFKQDWAEISPINN